ncbi:hypothetical protein L9F63_020577, partial [Diploptera punctata]
EKNKLPAHINYSTKYNKREVGSTLPVEDRKRRMLRNKCDTIKLYWKMVIRPLLVSTFRCTVDVFSPRWRS